MIQDWAVRGRKHKPKKGWECPRSRRREAHTHLEGRVTEKTVGRREIKPNPISPTYGILEGQATQRIREICL